MTIITPLCVMILLEFLQMLAVYQHGKEKLYPESYPLDGIENCRVYFGLVATNFNFIKI